MVVYIVTIAQCMVRALAAHFRDPQFTGGSRPRKVRVKRLRKLVVAPLGNLAALKLPDLHDS